MATTSRASTRTSLQLPRPIEPIKPLASEPRGPQTANLPLPAPTLHLFARAACSKQRRPPQPNLHSPNSRPAVQCNEGFCNARDGQRLTLTTSTASQKPHHYAKAIPQHIGTAAISALCMKNRIEGVREYAARINARYRNRPLNFARATSCRPAPIVRTRSARLGFDQIHQSKRARDCSSNGYARIGVARSEHKLRHDQTCLG